MKRVIGVIFRILILLVVIQGVVMTTQADAVTIPNGDFSIIADGVYQMSENYSGTITVTSAVYDVTITDAVYNTHRSNTSVFIAGGRSEALKLTIEDIDITAPTEKAGIDFSNAEDYENELYISGTCYVTGGMYVNWVNGGYPGIYVPEGISLIINSADNAEDNKLTATGEFYSAAIGSRNNEAGGNITINGGWIKANGGNYASGIGGGNSAAVGNVIINGGTVEAIGGRYSAGIGSSSHATGTGTITINGGTVFATSTNIVSGGSTFGGGAGIGSGYLGAGNTITINGGIVTASGAWFAAGIGGGEFGNAGIININGGIITATGGFRGTAGIGGGYGRGGGTVTISGAPTVYATGYLYGASDHIGRGDNTSSDSGTLKDASGDDLSYLRFDTEGVAGARIEIEGYGDDYLTNDQGICGIFVHRSGTTIYTISKAGYEAVKGTQALDSVNHSINITMTPDNTPPVIINATPLAMNTGTSITVTFDDDYGIYSTLYLVPKSESDYTDKDTLDDVMDKINVAIDSPLAETSIDTASLDDGFYQIYLADSAENVSTPINIVIDNIPPTVGQDTIYVKGITHNSTKLEWNKASDLATASAELKYCIYQSSASIENTIEEIEANGTVKQDYTADINELNITELEPGHTYYFNIIVTDNTGNKTCYKQARVITSRPSGRGSSTSESSSIQKPNETTIPVNTLAGEAGKTIDIITEYGTVSLPSNMLTAETAGDATSVTLTVNRVDAAKLPAGVQAQIGNKPVIELMLKLDGEIIPWDNLDAPVTVTIPYVPTAEELDNPENITIFYIDGAGNLFSVPSGRYNPATGKVSFSTTHFSKYAVVYVSKSFEDLGQTVWAKKQIEVLAAKGIMDGRSADEFVPRAGATRGEYLSALVRTMSLSAKTDTNFKDVSIDNKYHREIGIAKALGITNGVGNDNFNPETVITRMDMMVMTERTLRNLGLISEKGTMEDLNEFVDKTKLADYAVNSIAALVKEGLIIGSDGSLNAGAYTTRAEAAVFLYRIYNLP